MHRMHHLGLKAALAALQKEWPHARLQRDDATAARIATVGVAVRAWSSSPM